MNTSLLRQQTLSSIAGLAQRVTELEVELSQALEARRIAEQRAALAEASTRTAWRLGGWPHTVPVNPEC